MQNSSLNHRWLVITTKHALVYEELDGPWHMPLFLAINPRINHILNQCHLYFSHYQTIVDHLFTIINHLFTIIKHLFTIINQQPQQWWINRSLVEQLDHPLTNKPQPSTWQPLPWKMWSSLRSSQPPERFAGWKMGPELGPMAEWWGWTWANETWLTWFTQFNNQWLIFKKLS